MALPCPSRSSGSLPPESAFRLFGLALGLLNYEYDSESGLFIEQLGRRAVRIPDRPELTYDDALVSLVAQGVDRQRLVEAVATVRERGYL